MPARNVIITVPNLITVIRLVLVPVIIYLAIESAYGLAFALFIVAGMADALDGYVARRFHLTSQLGAHLDPLADKALLISLYIVLATIPAIPVWLAILVVSRDVLIIGAFLLSWVLGSRTEVRPLAVSKANTAAQIVLVAVVLADLAFPTDFAAIRLLLVVMVAMLTSISGTAYLVGWFRHMNLA